MLAPTTKSHALSVQKPQVSHDQQDAKNVNKSLGGSNKGEEGDKQVHEETYDYDITTSSDVCASPSENVYIPGLGDAATDETLIALTQQFGKIVSAKAIVDSSGRCKGYGFVLFSSQDEATKAIRGLKEKGYGEAVYAKTKFDPEAGFTRTSAKDPTNIYFTGLPEEFSEQMLESLLRPYGLIQSCYILRDRTGQSRGVGFARMSNTKECDTIIHDLNGNLSISGSNSSISCKYADAPKAARTVPIKKKSKRQTPKPKKQQSVSMACYDQDQDRGFVYPQPEQLRPYMPAQQYQAYGPQPVQQQLYQFSHPRQLHPQQLQQLQHLQRLQHLQLQQVQLAQPDFQGYSPGIHVPMLGPSGLMSYESSQIIAPNRMINGPVHIPYNVDAGMMCQGRPVTQLLQHPQQEQHQGQVQPTFLPFVNNLM